MAGSDSGTGVAGSRASILGLGSFRWVSSLVHRIHPLQLPRNLSITRLPSLRHSQRCHSRMGQPLASPELSAFQPRLVCLPVKAGLVSSSRLKTVAAWLQKATTSAANSSITPTNSLSLGTDGFRIDAAKRESRRCLPGRPPFLDIPVNDLQTILSRLSRQPSYVTQEVRALPLGS